MGIIDDKTKELKSTKEELQIKLDSTQLNLLVRKKGQKKDYDWCIGLVNTFEVYTIQWSRSFMQRRLQEKST